MAESHSAKRKGKHRIFADLHSVPTRMNVPGPSLCHQLHALSVPWRGLRLLS